MKNQGQKTILLVEDDAVTATVETHLLKSLGYDVVIAQSGEEAVQSAMWNDEIDLILMDINLGVGMDGTEAAKQILEKRHLPVIFLTAHTEKEYVERVKAITRYGYIIKNSDKFVIQSSIEMAFELFEMAKAIQESAIQKNAILNGITTNISLVDKALNILWANKAASNSVNKQPEDMIGHPCYAFWGDPARPCANCPALKAFRTRQSEHVIIQTPDGKILDEVGEPVFDKEGNVIAVVEIAQDITERKRAEEELRKSEVRFSSYFDLPLHGIAISSPEKGWMQVNERICSILGYTRDEILRMTWAQMTHPDDLAADVEQFERVLSGQIEQYHIEKRFIRKDGTFVWTRMAVGCVREPNGRVDYIVALLEDITGRKNSEEERENLQAQLAQTQKMESVGRLAGGVAHDFNNMLQIILGNVELAMAKTDPDNPICSDLEEVKSAGRRAADLTRQLLAFARKQTITPRTIDLNKTVESMLKMLRRLIGENIELVLAPRAGLWPVRMDPVQIDQILANLCVNAHNAIDGIGTVYIDTKNVRVDEFNALRHDGFLPGEYVLLTVSDTGSGMDKETQARIFEPFFTTKDEGKGTGLGLAIVYGIVRQNQGHIDVYSEQGQGTTFRIYLPRHIGAEAAPSVQGPVKSIARGCETVLLVDDEPEILHVAAMMLERQGYTVLAARAPGEAIRMAKAHPGKIHLLITDVVMPEMKGRDLVKNLLALDPHIKHMFMSGYPTNVIARHGVLDQGAHFIQKPFSMEDLATKVREVLAEA